jgi:hypothetical protein
VIPLSAQDAVTYTDSDKTYFIFKPRTGRLERELLTVYNESLSAEENAERIDSFIDKILINWGGVGMPVFPAKPSDVLNSEEKTKVLGFWREAGKISAEEKKV